MKSCRYRNFPKFSDRQVWTNSADPDQRSSLIRIYTVCHSVCIVWTHYSMVEPHSSNYRVITTNVLGVRIFRKFTVPMSRFSFQFQLPNILFAITLIICVETKNGSVYKMPVRKFCGWRDGVLKDWTCNRYSNRSTWERPSRGWC